MNRFAELLDRLVLTPSRNGKLTLLTDYFRSVEDPDRGLALAAITGDLNIAAIKPAMLRALVTERMDPVLFGYSYDYVGDLAETVSLVWPQSPGHIPNREPTLGEVVAKLQAASRSDGPKVLAGLLDSAGISARFAIIKLVTGGCVSAYRRGLPNRLWRISARSMSPRSRSSGTGCRRLTRHCSRGWKARPKNHKARRWRCSNR